MRFVSEFWQVLQAAIDAVLYRSNDLTEYFTVIIDLPLHAVANKPCRFKLMTIQISDYQVSRRDLF
jgi:hypothetical protein